MNRCNLQQNAVVSAYDHQMGGPVVCPKPRRFGVLSNNPNRPLILHLTNKAERGDMRAGAELLDIILKKEDFGMQQSATQVASSPPFFRGSPPTRVSNPLVQDAQFCDGRLAAPTLSTLQIPSPSSPSLLSLSARKGGCVTMKFGVKPATVRVEGFNCLNRDGRNSSIPAMA